MRSFSSIIKSINDSARQLDNLNKHAIVNSSRYFSIRFLRAPSKDWPYIL